ncbi:MAG: hypothetical protein K8S98_11460 [Planctomycetes bacterium]|nr:hypothetical protein [Planctomycetota bacterium]
MAPAGSGTHSEGLKAARLLMVLSSISPLFILWAIRGNSLICDGYFIAFCALMAVVPNAFLWLRISTAKKHADKRELIVGMADDHRDHILVYLFAMLLPFYSEDLGSWRYLGASVAALAFIVFLFWHLNLHYMNLLFAALGYRVFTVYPPADGNALTGKTRHAVITRRVSLGSGERLVAYRLSDTVYLEADA